MSGEPRRVSPASSDWLRPVVLATYAALILARAPAIIWPGRLYADEGADYFRDAYTQPWDTFFATAGGYYALVTRTAALAAAHVVPLKMAPIVTVLFALTVQLLPAWLLLYCRIPCLPRLRYRLCAVLLLLVVQPNQEVWLSTISCQFFLSLATAIILVSRPTGRTTHVARLAALGVAGLEGVVSCLLLPFFWVEYAWTRRRHKLHEALVLSGAGVLQAIAVLTSLGRPIDLWAHLLPFVLVTKQLVLPTLGTDAADHFAAFVADHGLFQSTWLVVVALVPLAALTLGLLRWGHRHAWLLLVAGLFVASVSFAASGEGVMHLTAYGGGRYYYAPNAMLALALLAPLAWDLRGHVAVRLFRVVCAGMVALTLVVGVCDFVHPSAREHEYFFAGPSWRSEAERWQSGETDELLIWPDEFTDWTWKVELPRRD